VFLEGVRTDLEVSSLFIELLSASEDAVADRPYLLLQDSAARDASRRGVPLLSWRPPGTDLEGITDEAWRRLLTGTIASSFEEFRQLVLSSSAPLLGQMGRSKSPPAPISQADSLAICVNVEPRDKELGIRVVEILAELGEEPLVAPDPAPEQPPADYHWQLDQVIEASEGIVIVYGQCPPAWVLAQYARARKVLAQKRRGIWGALVDGPPKEKPVTGVQSRSIMTLDCRDGPRPEPIAQFVEALRRRSPD
jgi:hypothetical protein